MAKLAKALVLVDVHGHGLKAGQIVEASADTIKSLTQQGSVDPNKEAVAYAASQGAKEVRSSVELEAEAAEAEAAAAKAAADAEAAKAGGQQPPAA